MNLLEINWAEYRAGWDAQSWKRSIPETASGQLGYRDRATMMGSSGKIGESILNREAEMRRRIQSGGAPKTFIPWWTAWADCFRVMFRGIKP